MIEGALWSARLLQLASALGLFGVAAGAARGSALPRWLLPAAAVAGVLSALAWLSCEAVTITGSWTAVPAVIGGTRMGQVLALRALLFTAVLVRPRQIPERALWLGLTLVGGILAASFAWTGHGAAGDDGQGMLHQAADVLHLLAAGLWIGALLELCAQAMRCLQTPQAAPARVLLAGLSRFSATGPAIVALLALTGVINSWVLIGLRNWNLLLATSYGLALLVKLALFAGMLALAAINRLRLTSRLQIALDTGTGTDAALGSLRRSLAAETALGLLVLAVVAWLGMLEPPADG